MITVTPSSRIARITGMMSRISEGLRPASTSSSRRSTGSVASARASSRRLRPATVSEAAGLSSIGSRPSLAAMSRAFTIASAREPCRRCAPTAMFSATLNLAKGCTI
jgi:hypothetical protein